MFFVVNYCNIIATFRLKRPVFFSKAERGASVLNLSDVILHLVDMVIAEKEKNFMLQQNQKQPQQMQDEKTNKD